jgi:HD superfamily phosphohydrolase
MNALRDIPEVAGLDGGAALVRIPPELDVPVTDRVRKIIDTAEYRRLARVSQLGLVSLVYPGALHTRLEHSLGVYRLALLFLRRLSYDERFAAAIDRRHAERFLVAALVHDIGHWPFCHPIEDIRLPDVPSHERLARQFLAEGELAHAIRDAWQIDPDEIVTLLSDSPADPPGRILASLLSGPIDIDKMDYLFRDSLHAGVPYGRNFDQPRLIGSLCLNAAADALAITEKGKTAAELMVFARYVMFSEVYWHHAVRSATAMLQRAFYLLRQRLNLASLFCKNEAEWIDAVLSAADGQPAGELLAGLFGPRRSLYKRLAQYSYFQDREIYERLARRPYPWLAARAQDFAHRSSAALGASVAPHEVIFDAPPVEREVEFDIDVYFSKEDQYRPLGEVSPVVHALARRQFDDYVKRVRIFVHPRVAGELRALPVRQLLEKTLDDAHDPP